MVIPFKNLVPANDPVSAAGQRLIGRHFVTDAYRYAAVQTPLAMRYLNQSGYSGQILVGGPLLRTRLPVQRDQLWAEHPADSATNDCLVVYAPSMRYALQPIYITQTMDEVCRSFKDVVDALSPIPGIHLVLRLHPIAADLEKGIVDGLDLNGKITVSQGARRDQLEDILAQASLWISDVSTSAEEAIQNRVPVILYDRWQRHNHFDAPRFEGGVEPDIQPAYYVTGPEELRKVATWILDNLSQGAVVSDQERSHYVYEESACEQFYQYLERWLGSRGSSDPLVTD